MKLIIKQKIISFLDSYKVYDENDNVVYTIKGRPSWGHKFKVFDAQDREVGCIRQKVLSLMPTFEIYQGGLSGWKNQAPADHDTAQVPLRPGQLCR